MQRTLLLLLRSISSHVSKSKNLHVSAVIAMPLSTPWPSWRPCVISRFTAVLMPSLPLCSPPVTTTTTTTALLNSPRIPPSRCCCPSAPQQSDDPPHQSNRCSSASHAVTRAASTQHPCHIHIPTSRISCTMSRPSPLTCPCLPSRLSSGA